MNGRRRPESLEDANRSFDWQAHTEALSKLPSVSEMEWEQIFSFRSFQAEHHQDAKSKILKAIFLLRRLNLAGSAFPDSDFHLEQLSKAITLVNDLLSNFLRPNHQLALLLHGLIDDSVLALPVLPPKELARYQEATERFLERVRTVTRKRTRKASGPDNSAAVWFLSQLDEVARAYSAGGGLTRSTKNRPSRGNDRLFIEKLFEIAGREAGVSVGRGTIEGAIRRLKVATTPERNNRNSA